MQDTTGTPLTAPEQPPGSPPRPGATGRTLVPFAIVALVTLLVDQASKMWALSALEDGHVVGLVDDLLSLRLIRNPGAAFSLGDSMTWVMTVIALLVTLAILLAGWRAGSRRWAGALGALLGGSLGNLADRFFREPGPGRGHVIDFIDYGGLFVGNVADIAIVAGAFAMIVLMMRDIALDGTAGGRHARTTGDGRA